MANLEEIRNMVLSFRVSELQDLLGFAGRNKTGKKNELQARALELVKMRNHPIQVKVMELHKRRFHVMNMGPGSSADSLQVKVPMGPSSDAPSHSMSRSNPMMNYPPMPYSSSHSSHQVKPMALTVPSATSSSGYPVYPDVKLKALPFYDIMGVLLKPSSLIPSGNTSFQENNFAFHLSPQQVSDIQVSREFGHEYGVQIQLRFCMLETSCEQDDNFPPSICVKINNKLCQLPNPIPTNRPGVEPKRPSRPVNITNLCRHSATTSNNIIVSWASEYGRPYVIAVYLVRKLDSSTLLSRLRSKGMRNPDHTRAMIKEKLAKSPDSEIATTSLRGSLICPIGKMKMQIPCRPTTCKHLQCFDANLFLKMNEKKPRWICPVCDKPATFSDLAIDGLFNEISAKAPSQCTEVQFHEDGSWTPIMQEREAHDVDGTRERSPVRKPKQAKKDAEVIDLTLDSDSDENDWSASSSTLSKSYKQSNSGAPSLSMPMSSSSIPYSTKVSTTAAFIPLTSPSSPSMLSPYDGFNSSSISFPQPSISAPKTTASASYSVPIPTAGPMKSTSSMNQKNVIDSDLRTNTSSRNPVLGNSMYSNIPFINYSPTSPNYSPASPPPTERGANDLGAPSTQVYGEDFDLFSLLQATDSEQNITAVPNTLGQRKTPSNSPDVISLD